MEGKQAGVIKKITVTDATYDNETVKPNIINFFYGNNGSGKTTIGRTNDSGLGIEKDIVANDYSILVYNRDFIRNNLNYAELEGIFTISEESIEQKEKLAQATSSKKLQDDIATKARDNISLIEEKLASADADLESKLWANIGSKFKKEFNLCLKGFMTQKAFMAHVLQLPTAEEQDLNALKEKYDTAYNSTAKIYAELTVINSEELKSNNLLGESITSSS